MSRDELWMDLVEGELNPAERQVARGILKNSQMDKLAIEELQDFKEEIKLNDELASLEVDDDFFDQLHDKIMAKVENTQIAPPPSAWQRWRASHRHWTMAGTSLSLTLIVFTFLAMASYFRDQQENQSYSFAAEILLESQDTAHTALSLTSYQIDQDLLVEYANKNFDQLSLQQVERLVGTL